VFLDEVGELPLSMQAKLLRVIEAREIVRVGGVRPRKIDVRFIAATNRDLEAEVQRNAFRRDLFFRLAGIILVVPPLRERPLDLPRLAREMLAQLAKRGGHRRPPPLSDAATGVLAGHGWPGNVRELRNVIERALLLCDGAAITPAHLGLGPTGVSSPGAEARAANGAPPPGPMGAGSKPSRDSALDRSRVLEALAACGGNQSRAARRLGVSRKVLIARLNAYGVARPRKSVPK
jgi:DNA-binding NtrC family response regulator